MRRLVGPLLLTFLVLPLFVPSQALAADKKKDDDDDLPVDDATISPDDFAEDEEDEPPTKRLESDDSEEADPDNLDFDEEDEGPALDFGDDTTQTTVQPRGPGEDTAQLYRDAQKKYGAMNAEEEILRWEKYLQKYPNSLYKDRVEQRMDELSQVLYGERVEGSDRGEKPMDAALREINMARPQRFGGADPRTHLTAGLELGIPNWFGLRADFEYQLMRPWSAHGGIKRGFSGWELGVGTRYAVIKSSRTKTVISGGLDLNLNAAPTYVSIQPMIDIGQRIDLMDGLDLQLELAPVIELYAPAGLRYSYGFNANLQLNPVVGVFLETTGNMKYLGDDDVDGFIYNVGTFGLKFVPAQGKGENKDGRLVLNLAANVPYVANYWSFYQGNMQLGAEYYF